MSLYRLGCPFASVLEQALALEDCGVGQAGAKAAGHSNDHGDVKEKKGEQWLAVRMATAKRSMILTNRQ